MNYDARSASPLATMNFGRGCGEGGSEDLEEGQKAKLKVIGRPPSHK